jgi:hypothetical protein
MWPFRFFLTRKKRWDFEDNCRKLALEKYYYLHNNKPGEISKLTRFLLEKEYYRNKKLFEDDWAKYNPLCDCKRETALKATKVTIH